VSYLSASAVVIHYEEGLYQVYAPLPLPLPLPLPIAYRITEWCRASVCPSVSLEPISQEAHRKLINQ